MFSAVPHSELKARNLGVRACEIPRLPRNPIPTPFPPLEGRGNGQKARHETGSCRCPWFKWIHSLRHLDLARFRRARAGTACETLELEHVCQYLRNCGVQGGRNLAADLDVLVQRTGQRRRFEDRKSVV